MSEWTLSHSKQYSASRSRPLTTDQLLADLEVDEMLQDSERSLQGVRQSSQSLRHELESMSQKRLGLKHLQTTDSPASHNSLRVPETSLALEDYISHGEVLDFMRNYLPGKTRIATSELLSCLELDFPDEMSAPGCREELARRVEGEQGWVSLNRLQALTKRDGLTGAIAKVARELTADSEDESKHVSAAIVTEMTELNSLLERKTKSLSVRETQLSQREREFEGKYSSALAQLQSEALKLADSALQEVRTNAAVHIRRIQALEKRVAELLKSPKPAPEKPTVDVGKWKARVQALEKTNEHLKAKAAALEGELVSHKTQVQKLSEDLGRAKARATHFEQVANEVKAQISREPKTVEPVPTPPPTEPVETNLSAETALAMSVFGAVTAALSQQLSATETIGQLLYPRFEPLVTKLVEFVPITVKAKQDHTAAEETIGILHSLLVHAFAQSLAGERYPSNLDFSPPTWRQKLSAKQVDNTPLYSLFANSQVQQYAITSISRYVTSRTDCDIRLVLQSATLSLLLSTSAKRLSQSLQVIKSYVTDQRASEFLMKSRSLLAVLATMRNEKREVATRAGEVALALSVSRDFPSKAAEFESATKGFEVSANQIVLELAARVLGTGEDRSDFEDYLILLLQKLTAAKVLTVLKRDPITALLIARVRALQGRLAEPEIKFILDNMSSILQHAK